MSPKSRRSRLQIRILIRLEQGPVRIVSDLAESIGAQRPSVSRSLKTLRNDKLVVRGRNGWALTFTGEQEAKRRNQELANVADSLRLPFRPVAPLTGLQRELSAVTSRAVSPIHDLHRERSAGNARFLSTVNDLNRKNSADILRSISPLNELLRKQSAGIARSLSVINDLNRKNVAATLGFLSPIHDLHREQSAGIARSLSVMNDLNRKNSAGILRSISPINDLHREFSRAFTQSISPLVDIHRGMSMATAQSIAIPDLGLVISRNNAMVARSIEDLHAVYSAPDVRANGFEKVLYPRVLGDLHDISGTYRGLFYESMKIADAKPDSIEMQDSWTRMLMPGSTVANFTRSLRSEVAPLPETDRGGLAQPPLHEQPKELLERLLKDLNPDLADRWNGSWQVLSDTNPDRISQAAFSYRELVRMVLDELAPGVEPDPLVHASKRKRQVRHVLSGREGDFAVAMVEGLPRLYDFLSKSAHTSYRNDVAVQAALVAGDGLLLMLLSSRQDYVS